MRDKIQTHTGSLQTREMDWHKNSLNTFRLLAALSVMFIHGFTHMNASIAIGVDNFFRYFMGIPLFFSLSGFLLWQSRGSDGSFFAYARKRFRRIYPELWLGIGVELAVLLVLFREPIRWGMLALFALAQGTILQFWTPDFLRSYGCGSPNGALWSICTLIQFYVLLYFARKVLKGRKTWVWLLILAVSILLGVSAFHLEGILPTLIIKLYHQSLFPYLWLFVAGMLVAEKREVLIPFFSRWWWVFASLTWLIRLARLDIGCGYYGLLSSYTLIAAVLGAAYRFPRINVKKDISYGIYIYHMTVMNAMIELGYTQTRGYLLTAMAITCLLAFISTEIFGRRAKPEGKGKEAKV